MSVGKVLQRVRELRYLDIEEVAGAANISEARLREFEADERDPSQRQLEKLSSIYGVPSYWLYGEAVPNLPELISDFRKVHPRPARLTPSGLQKLWAAERRSQFTSQLSDELKLTPPAWLGSVPSGTADAIHAAKLRSYFDSWLAPRIDDFGFVGMPEQIFMQSFRLFMEVQGLVVNVNDAAPEDFMGFYVSPKEGIPIAFVNRKISSKKAQLFTLLHETCHHLTRQEGVSNPFVIRNSVERDCNRFAAEFIAPLRPFRRLVEAFSKATREDVFDLVQKTSQRSLLSRHASAIRLLEADFITQAQLGTWEKSQARRGQNEKDEEETSGRGQVHAKRIGELGYLPTYLASKAVAKKIVDSIDVRNGLDLSEGLQERAFILAERRFKAARAA